MGRAPERPWRAAVAPVALRTRRGSPSFLASAGALNLPILCLGLQRLGRTRTVLVGTVTSNNRWSGP